MRLSLLLLVLLLPTLAGCDRPSSGSVDQNAALAAALPGLSAPASKAAEQDTMPLVSRRVWADAASFCTPTPDGRHLVFTDWDTGDLAIRDLHTGGIRSLTNKTRGWDSWAYAEYSSVSPDGLRVAFAWFSDEGLYELHVINLDGSNHRVLVNDSDVSWLAPYDWTSDGRSILAFVSREEEGSTLAFVSVADGTTRVIRSLAEGRTGWIKLSPDGRFVAYDFASPDDPKNSDVFVASVESGSETQVVDDPSDEQFLGWSPDGRHLLFTSNRTGTVGAWLLPVESGRAAGNARLVKPDMWRVSPMGFVKDGSYFYRVATTNMDVFQGRLDLSTGRLTEDPSQIAQRFVGSNADPKWSPDGQRLAFQSMRSARPGNREPRTLVIRSELTGETRELTPNLATLNRYRWSPDGRSLLVRGRDTAAGSWGAFSVDVQTGRTERILLFDDQYKGRWTEWSADGRSILFTLENFSLKEGEGPQIVMRDLEIGTDRVLFRGAGGFLLPPSTIALSPDRKRIAFIVSDEQVAFPESSEPRVQLFVTRVGGGQAEEIHRFRSDDPSPRMLTWTPDGGHIVFLAWDGEGIWRLPAEGGALEKLEWEGAEGQVDIRFHPDGERIAFTGDRSGSEVWVMEGFLPGHEIPGGERRVP